MFLYSILLPSPSPKTQLPEAKPIFKAAQYFYWASKFNISELYHFKTL